MRKNHDGSPIDPKDVFFAEPPPEIGEVLSASTTVAPRAQKRRAVLRVVQAIACGLGGAIFLGLFGGIAGGHDHGLALLGIGALVGLCGGAWAGAAFLVPDFCSYVGRDGAVLFIRYGTIVRKKLVPFVAAGDLRIHITRVLLAGRHIGDVHHVRVISTGGATLLTLKAPTAGASAEPGAHLHFVAALQRAWQAHRANRVAA